ncbi:hypothetical protein OsJ_04452 [Oryza sativa Japonica Group]|uniref:Uncharacterized protein n=1 Tax=Oryza sativa subsp. japonica TaxID=39947 RepID=A3A0N2_ORYSJ|nr:hypothetical protein OsJ_04452 [Oryza sativa Japonica Group]
MTATGTDMTAALQALLDPTALSLGLPTPAINKEEYLAICLAALAGTRAKALVGVGRRAAGAGLQAVVPEARGGERRRAWRRRGLVATLRNIVRRPLAFPSASGSCGPADADACALIARLLAKDPAARCPRPRRRAAALVAVVQGGADNAATADDEGGLLRCLLDNNNINFSKISRTKVRYAVVNSAKGKCSPGNNDQRRKNTAVDYSYTYTPSI